MNNYNLKLIAGGRVRQGVHAGVPAGVRGRRQDVLEPVQDGEDGVRGGQGGRGARGGAVQEVEGVWKLICSWCINLDLTQDLLSLNK